ncbi:MAG: hypothetical protein H8E86_03725 [Planctomycetes bacterium]|nr:hypothetical protein [Planctomycetota bacterium]
MSLLILLVIIAGLLLLIGFTAFITILILAKRHSFRPDNKSKKNSSTDATLDPWAEAGNRIDIDNPEQEK